MKQSPDFKQLQPMRLLRYARNDTTGDFLRDHQVLILIKYGDSCPEQYLLTISVPSFWSVDADAEIHPSVALSPAV